MKAVAAAGAAIALAFLPFGPGPDYPPPVGPLPTRAQLAWQELEFTIFMHFGPNTFTGVEWGEGNEDVDVFNPEALDCGQWARIVRESGARGIVITAKHHDGFCLWPSDYSTHTVRESRWRGGKGDILRDLSEACRNEGLKFGVYVSPWDRNHPRYGTPEYNDVFAGTMTEVLTRYGPVFELWWDGANGEGPNGRRQEYDFRRFERTVREISPSTVIFSDIGPDIRWVGNEAGIAGETHWYRLDTAGFGRGATSPPVDTLNRGNEEGAHWIPSECDVSIRPGWFHRSSEDTLVKSPRDLMRLYLLSVGRGSHLLLNVPPGPDGRIAAPDSASLAGFRALRDEFFRTDLAAGARARSTESREGCPASALTDADPASAWSSRETSAAPSAEIDLDGERRFNTVLLREGIALGQRVQRFAVDAWVNGGWREIAGGTTVGLRRILQFPPVSTSKVRLRITGAKAPPVVSGLSLYLAPNYLDGI